MHEFHGGNDRSEPTAAATQTSGFLVMAIVGRVLAIAPDIEKVMVFLVVYDIGDFFTEFGPMSHGGSQMAEDVAALASLAGSKG